MDKWKWRTESFWNWLSGSPPEPGDDDFIGAPTMEDYFNTRSVLNPFVSTKIDDYFLLLLIFYGIYKIYK